MRKRRKIISPDHAEAMIEEAIGKIEGDVEIEAEGTAEITAIESAHGASRPRSKLRPQRRK